MNERLDRRAFLAGLGLAGLSLAGADRAAALVPRPRPRTPPTPRTLREAVRGPVIERGSPGFAAAAHPYNERFDYVSPRAVVRPLDPADLSGAVRWAVAHDVPLRARSGGHSYAGYSTLKDGVVVDVRNMRGIGFDRRTGIAAIGTGAQLIDVYSGLAAHGATIPAGSCPSVGVAGVTLGGGMGLAGRAFGLTADNLRSAQIVTADGRRREVDARSDPELLWALRGGGGGNFGIVTSLRFRVHRLPRSAAWFIVSWPWRSAEEALAAWQSWAPHARDELTSIFHLQTGSRSPSVLVAGQYLGRSGDLRRLLAPLTGVSGARAQTGDQDYLGLQLRWAGCLHQSLGRCHTVGTSPGGTLERASFRAKSDYVVRPLSSAGRRRLIGAIEIRQGQSGSGAILFDAYGGAINRVASDATAFVHRGALYCIQYLAYDGGAAWLGQTYAGMRPDVSGMAYQNYIDADLAGWRRAYYGANYPRLLAVRRRVDPDHRFNFPQAIGR